MTTKTKLAPLNIGVKNNQLMCDKNGSDFIDLLADLGWDYQRMSVSGREIYDNICHLLNAIPENEVYMEI